MNDRNDQNCQPDEHDPRLEALFAREHTHLAAEPFSSATLQAVAAERKRKVVTRRLLQASAVLVVIVLAPQLIDGSVWLSSRLDQVFAVASSLLASPYGMGAAALVVLVAWATRWARVW